jgi:hypothetical protein
MRYAFGNHSSRRSCAMCYAGRASRPSIWRLDSTRGLAAARAAVHTRCRRAGHESRRRGSRTAYMIELVHCEEIAADVRDGGRHGGRDGRLRHRTRVSRCAVGPHRHRHLGQRDRVALVCRIRGIAGATLAYDIAIERFARLLAPLVAVQLERARCSRQKKQR